MKILENLFANNMESGQELSVHGWINSLEDGIVKNLNVCVAGVCDHYDTYRVNLP